MMKKALSLLLTLAMVMSMFTLPAAAINATDTAADYVGSIELGEYDQIILEEKSDGTTVATVYYQDTAPVLTGISSTDVTVEKKTATDGNDIVVKDFDGNKVTLLIGSVTNSEERTIQVQTKKLEGDMSLNESAGTLADGTITCTDEQWDALNGDSFNATVDPALTASKTVTDNADGTKTLTVTGTRDGKVWYTETYTLTRAESGEDEGEGEGEGEETPAAPVAMTASLQLVAPGQVALTKATYEGAEYTLSDLALAEDCTLPDGVTFTAGKLVATNASAVTADSYTLTFTGKATIDSEKGAQDVTVTVTLRVTKAAFGFSISARNGMANEFKAGDDLFAAAAADLNSTLSLTGTNELTVSAMTIGVPASSTIFTVKKNSGSAVTGNVTLASSDKLVVTPTAGRIDLSGEEWDYTVTASNGSTYTGKLVVKSIYAGEYEVEQDADFTREWFYLDSFGRSSGAYSITEVREYSASVTAYNSSYVTPVDSYVVTPESVTTDWTLHLIGYTSSHVACKVDVKFKAAIYDMVGAAKDGEADFLAESDFLDFAKKVWAEQNASRTYANAYVESVEFGTSSSYDFYDGNKKVTTSTYECKDLSDVSIKVKNAGIVSVPFTINAKVSSSIKDTVNGTLYLTVSSDGDIQYEVSADESVTFDVTDFQAFYRANTSRSNAKLDRVIFSMGQPQVGNLYREPNRTNRSYLVADDDIFYVDKDGQLELDDVTYAAPRTPKSEYSVYIPFTAYGNSTAVSGVVEIIVNGKLPFTDIPESHTFYDEIRYCYREGIMGGKSETYFDAKSSVTRLQLVTTLYRIAGKPSQYNHKTITFSDCKNISNTEMANALKWAINLGIVDGYSDNTYRPNNAVTRQAMVTILYRFADKCGYDTSVSSRNNLNGYKDASSVSAGMKDAMNWAVENKLVSGNNGKLLPGGATTRGATAKILANFHALYIG